MSRENEKGNIRPRLLWVDAVGPAFILVLVTSYFLPWAGSLKRWGVFVSSKNGFDMWGRILSKPVTKNAAFVFLILLLISSAAVLILFVVRRFVPAPTGKPGIRNLLGRLFGGAALTAAFSSLVPAVLIIDRLAGRPPGPGFFLGLLAGLGLAAAGVISFVLSGSKQQSSKEGSQDR